MIVNLSVILLILILGLLFSNGKTAIVDSDYNRKRYIQLICLILILQSGLRNVAVGADTYSYFNGFETIKTTSWQEIWLTMYDYYSLGIGKDPGFFALQKIIQIILPNFQFFLTLIALIFFYSLGSFIYLNTKKLSDAVFAFLLYSSLFYLFFSITGLRQTVATAAVLWSYEFVKRRRLIAFLVIIMIASTVHKSSLIFIPFYFIANLKSARLIYSFLVFLFPIFFYYNIEISEFLTNVGGYDQYQIYEGAGAYTFTFALVIVAGISWWRMKATLWHNKTARPFYYAIALALILAPLTFFNPSAMRVVQYFSIFLLVLLPAVIQSFQYFSIRIRQTVYLVAIILLLTLTLRSNWNNEYKFFWQEMELRSNYK